MTKKILVTGGTGFIGSHLVEALIDRGDHVTVLDNFSTGKRGKIADYKNQLPSTLVKGDIMDSGLVQDLIQDCDQVYHLAAVVGVKNVFEHPLKTLDINILGTNNVLKLAALAGKKVLFTSSSEAYGSSGAGRYSEYLSSHIDPVSVNFRSVYGLSKLVGEQIALTMHAQLGLKVVVGRLFNTIGPRQLPDYGMVVPRFVEQAIKGEALLLYGGGKQTRTFIDVRDTVRALILLMDSKNGEGEVFNIGGNRPISIEGLARIVHKITGSRSPIYAEEFPYGIKFRDFSHRVPDTTKIRKWLGFKPEISLEETIKDVVAFVRGQLGSRVAA